MPVSCEPFEPMIITINAETCRATVTCNGAIRFEFILSETTITEPNGGYRIQDHTKTWEIPSGQASEYDLTDLRAAIDSCTLEAALAATSPTGTCDSPVYTLENRQYYCFQGITVYRSKCDGLFYDLNNQAQEVNEGEYQEGACGFGTPSAITYNSDTVANHPWPSLVRKISFKNDAATDLEISFDSGASYPFKIYLSSGIISFGDFKNYMDISLWRVRGVGASKYLVFWEV